jgi:hypothetical protein
MENSRTHVADVFLKHNIVLTPGGSWTFGDDGKKTGTAPYSTHRKNNPNNSVSDMTRAIAWADNEWLKHNKDNMAKHYLSMKQNILVFDIDKEPVDILPPCDTYPNGSIHIPALHLTMPLSLYSQTTTEGKYHIYYKVEDATKLPSRVVGLMDTDIDTFTYGNIFEWHAFAGNYIVYDIPMVDAPSDLLAILDHLGLPCGASSTVRTMPNIQRYNLITKFLSLASLDVVAANSVTKHMWNAKQWFVFFKNIMPKESVPPNRKKLGIEDFPLTYDLFNKIAVKLTATAELGYEEHVLPSLYKLLEMWGIDPMSKKSQALIHRNIMPSLPKHPPIVPYSLFEDTEEFQAHLDNQPNTDNPVFRVIEKGHLMYMHINKLSWEVQKHHGHYFFDEKVAHALHPERQIVNEDGKVIGWDSNVPIIYYMNDPYKQQYVVDEETFNHTINLYTRSRYLKEARAVDVIPENNIIYKAMMSTIGQKWLRYVLYYHAYVLFGDGSLNMVLWMASLPTDKGGTGKSIATVELLSLIAGGAVQSINEKTALSGWGDVVASARLISLEDMTDLSTKDWDQVYAMIKQSTSNAYRRLNMKGGAIVTQRVNVTISGSSNHRPMLPPSDRRFLCLEPAHLRGITERLSDADGEKLSRIMHSHSYSEEVQEYVDYLYYLYSLPLDDEMSKALYRYSPETEYRSKWIMEGATNTQNVVHTISDARELIGLIKMENELDTEQVIMLFQFVMHTWNRETSKAAVSWKWFAEILPFIMSDKYSKDTFSKLALSKMLQIDFTNVGIKYSSKWREGVPRYLSQEWSDWPFDGYVFRLTEDGHKLYADVVQELQESLSTYENPEM